MVVVVVVVVLILSNGSLSALSRLSFGSPTALSNGSLQRLSHPHRPFFKLLGVKTQALAEQAMARGGLRFTAAAEPEWRTSATATIDLSDAFVLCPSAYVVACAYNVELSHAPITSSCRMRL